ncbi:hypothetical protein [Criibacterium bergeronii]|uniref:DUF1579 domain-containing protein n=1 Tax=Criibacterium bergeronii TaxID=1871336 RepID=A0A371INR6_9FIRM|nr:hypothetical protein [Criibacterium bergeronii]MBS6062493.1 hypothetical protein [Peptostreptococcaceae bacterium]RDY22125.1 hypothetical protein BBG48_001915 [Criibacterium bergeronii]TRW27782.1 hypothetical protein FL857_04235 [Criibacterium bergeronii]
MEFYNALIGEENDTQTIFDPLIGDWELEWVDSKNTDHERHVKGQWYFSKILNGDGIQDIFICPSREERKINPQPDAEYGTTIRLYNQKTKKWDICYACTGKMVRLEAEKIGDEIILTNLDKSNGLNLWVFSDITSNRFHWENKSSFDDGKTWQINGEVYAKRK